MAPIQILLTLLWVSASFLTTIASPLMIPVDVGADDLTGMTRIVYNRQAFVRRTNPKPVSKVAAKPLKAPVQLWIRDKGLDVEHWSLVIGSDVFEAVNPPGEVADDEPPPHLIPRTFPYHPKPESDSKLIDLHCIAKFNTKEEMDDTFSQLEKIRMTLRPTQVGGNCIDYIKMALRVLQKRKHIRRIPAIFWKLYNKNYKEVRKLTWGGVWPQDDDDVVPEKERAGSTKEK
ncbi:hypothetical protein BDP27DRAFT_1426345 [Rhodocollybia butyracea]|uniref:Uncharacterized protein n=1 Tax=Rhodocollybia butyracea TaxID=206335 RepID=A0A9P5PIR5_9AGAR|nr:hypothetical protein BDP27DRAFT_1426345 [Rhodocollybia butyracea]